MKKNSLKRVFSSLAVATVAVSAYSVAAFAEEGDGGFTAAQIEGSVNKPIIAVEVDGVTGGKVYALSDVADKTVNVKVNVAGANAQYASTGLHIYYDKALDVVTDDYGDAAVAPGNAIKGLSANPAENDPTAADQGMKGFFVATAGKANYGLDGTMWTFDLKVPATAKVGDVFGIDIIYKSSKNAEDLFVNAQDDEVGKIMQAYLFTRGIHNYGSNYTFAASTEDVAKCAALADLDKSYDGYIAIGKASQTKPAAPTLANAAIDSITLTAITNGQYKCGDGAWQDSPTFTGLAQNTSYTFYQRIKGDSDHDDSPASDGAEFSTINHTHSWGCTASGATITAACSGEGTCEITTGLTMTISAPAGSLVYDGTPKEATLNNDYSTTAFPGSYPISYYKGTTALNGAPAEAGTYTAKVTAGTATAQVDFTIEQAVPTITTAPTASAITYGQTLADSTLSGGAADVPGTFTWTTPTIAPAAADSDITEYDVTFTPNDTDNYTTAACKVKLTVGKAESSVTAVPKPRIGLIYSGASMVLVSKGTGEGGTMVYSLDGKNFSAELPRASAAGTYTIYYKVKGDDNHNDSDIGSVESKIGTYSGGGYTPPTPSHASSSDVSGTSASGQKLRAVLNADNSLTVDWDKISGASKYILYYEKDGKDVKVIETAKNKVTIKTAKNNFTYKFKLKYITSGQTLDAPTGYTATLKSYYKPAVKLTQKDGKVTASWKKVPGADSYKVYKVVNGKLKFVTETTKNAVRFSAKSGSTVTYSVSAVIGGSETKLTKSDRKSIKVK